MVTIISRSEWGAQKPKKIDPDPFTPWKGGVVIHHEGGGNKAVDPHDQCAALVRKIQDDSMNYDIIDEFEVQVGKKEDPYDDIPYNFVVCKHGGIYEGRGADRRSAANSKETPGANSDYYAIMGLIGSDDDVTPAMVRSITVLCSYLRSEKGAGSKILGHTDVRPKTHTDCPGKLYPYVQRDEFRTGAGTGGGPDSDTLHIYGRAQWGARPAKDITPVDISARTGFTVHYSDGPTTQTLRSIQNYHMDSNGWSDIGYNFLVDTSGRIFEGRGWYLQGAHAYGANTSHIGVCFIGESGDATDIALSAIRSMYEKACDVAGHVLDKTYHGMLPGNSTDCPGAQLRAWVQNGMQAQVRPIDWAGADYTPPPTDSSGANGGGMTQVRSVSAQQQAVNDLGYSPALAVDGAWGPLTDAGVRWLQNKVGATADGLWGPGTESAFRAFGGGGSSSGGGMSSVRSVARQQQAVNDLGYSPALAVDGAWGPLTDAGVRWLQGKVGTAADGQWGPATESAYFAYIDDGAGLTVDGQFGTLTIMAVQRVCGSTPDGQWGPDSKRSLQHHLNVWGNAGLVEDGDPGPATYKALQTFLNASGAGLTVDGQWGPATISALQNALNQGRF
ncbi:peptidoglycan-binding protein [Streptomyces sp. CBMA123]|uniref:peptidoglycan recognition protein family protein n=1 Tax=Streptomyces sp. CBMA123 TaxID=1896313 RepID=UPI001661B4F9|nr:peptidoglycan-binding protein [Streptomyces sp. CBMA123]MBD0690792.1 peptidoglycan recognition protein [Streptomyces sp. CBMA123]